MTMYISVKYYVRSNRNKTFLLFFVFWFHRHSYNIHVWRRSQHGRPRKHNLLKFQFLKFILLSHLHVLYILHLFRTILKSNSIWSYLSSAKIRKPFKIKKLQKISFTCSRRLRFRNRVSVVTAYSSVIHTKTWPVQYNRLWSILSLKCSMHIAPKTSNYAGSAADAIN